MRVTDSSSFGALVKNKRKKLGYTQKYISEFTGISVSFLSDLENGKPTCEVEKTLKVLSNLGIRLMVQE